MLEGAAFGLRDALDVLLAAGARPRRLVATGGGMRLPIWRRIVADVFGRPLVPVLSADQSALRAALLTGSAVGSFPDLASAVQRLVHHGAPILPDPSAVDLYEPLFRRYQQLYPLTRAAPDQGST